MISDEVINFYTSPPFSTVGTNHLQIHNPFSDQDRQKAITSFCKKYYDDDNRRIHLLGINPSKINNTSTGVNYTDGFALENFCEIDNKFSKTRELTSKFFYNVVENMGGSSEFYSRVFAWALMPLSITKGGSYVNYYDKEVVEAIRDVIISNILWLGDRIPNNKRAVVLGIGENKKAFSKMDGYPFIYDHIEYLPHPRWIMQYKSNDLDKYIAMYAKALSA